MSLLQENFTVQPLTVEEQGEKCEVCGAANVEFKVYFEGQWLKRCRQCVERIKRFTDKEKPSETLLFQCMFCVKMGKPMFFATKQDLERHVLAFHGGYPDAKARLKP